MKSSVSTSLASGRPSLARWATDRARSKRPLLATMTRSVMSRSTGLAALRSEPQAHDPLAPSAFCQISSPRSSRPRSCSRMRITSADRLRYGLRPRLATLTAMRPPGSSVRTHSANTVVSMSRYSRSDDGALAPQLLLVLLAGEVRRRGHHQGHRADGHRVHVPGIAVDKRLGNGCRRGDRVVGGHGGWREAVVERPGVVTLPGADANVRRDRSVAGRHRLQPT